MDLASCRSSVGKSWRRRPGRSGPPAIDRSFESLKSEQRASCVVFDGGSPQTSQYRRMNIETVSDGDDYGAMKDALTRRAARTPTGEV